LRRLLRGRIWEASRARMLKRQRVGRASSNGLARQMAHIEKLTEENFAFGLTVGADRTG